MNEAAVQAIASRPPRYDVRAAMGRARQPAVGLLAGMVVWEAIAHLWNQPFFPPLSIVLRRLVEMTISGAIINNLASSLTNLALGFALSAIVGLTVGALMGAYRRVEMALDVYVYALLITPALVFAPVFFAIFGLSRLAIVGVVFVYTTWVIILNTAAAIRTVPGPLLEMARSYSATERQLFFEVILPSALPLVMAGLRLGMGLAVKGMINGEMFIAAVGLGAIVMEAEAAFDAATVLAVLLVIIVVVMLAVKAIQLVDQRLTSWLPSTARQGPRT